MFENWQKFQKVNKLHLEANHEYFLNPEEQQKTHNEKYEMSEQIRQITLGQQGRPRIWKPN